VLLLGAGPASQPTTRSDSPELTERQQNLLLQLSDTEANIQAINKALKATGYDVGSAYDRIDSSLRGNEIMDRKGGGPVRWDAFYGKTAKAYANNGWGDHRPQQFEFIYKANDNQIARAKDRIASLVKDQQSLLDRRQKHESDQSRLWATISWEQVKDREIEIRPLYRHALKPTGASQSVLRPVILYLRTANEVAQQGLASVQTEQGDTFHSASRHMEAAFAVLQKSIADALDSDDLKPDQVKEATALKQLCKNVAEDSTVISENFDNALDRDKAKEDGSKLQFRGQLQSSLSSFASDVGQLDDEITRAADDWGVKADKTLPSPDSLSPIVVAAQTPEATGHASAGFGVGDIWVGTVRWNSRPGESLNYTLVITDRTGDGFKGIYRLDHRPSGTSGRIDFTDVEGTVTAGGLQYRQYSEQVTGELKGDALVIKAVGGNGDVQTGELRLKPR
jgi:hypothetical protein